MGIKQPDSLAESYEKQIFPFPEDPKKIKARIRNSDGSETGRETESQTASRFYLQKILHLLLADNIPDAYGFSPKAGDEGYPEIILEKMDVDSTHREMQEARNRQFELDRQNISETDPARMGLVDFIAALETRREQNPHVIELMNKLRNLFVDRRDVCSGRNYAFYRKGSRVCVVFLDNQVAWKYENGKKKPVVNFTALKQAAEALGEPARSEALGYYKQLFSLYERG